MILFLALVAAPVLYTAWAATVILNDKKSPSDNEGAKNHEV